MAFRSYVPARHGTWLFPLGLLALCVLPILGGVARLAHMGVVTPETARFVAAPVPVVVHVLASLLYAVLGAFQFSDGLRRRFPRWHRTAGKLLVVCGLAAALSGIWMTLAFPITKPGTDLPSFDGLAVYLARLAVGVGMAVSLVLGVRTIQRGDVAAHQAWMLRAYALGLGAGTQALTHLPWFLFPAIRGETARAVGMVSAWVINLAIAEWWLARRPARQALPRTS